MKIFVCGNHGPTLPAENQLGDNLKHDFCNQGVTFGGRVPLSVVSNMDVLIISAKDEWFDRQIPLFDPSDPIAQQVCAGFKANKPFLLVTPRKDKRELPLSEDFSKLGQAPRIPLRQSRFDNDYDNLVAAILAVRSRGAGTLYCVARSHWWWLAMLLVAVISLSALHVQSSVRTFELVSRDLDILPDQGRWPDVLSFSSRAMRVSAPVSSLTLQSAVSDAGVNLLVCPGNPILASARLQERPGMVTIESDHSEDSGPGEIIFGLDGVKFRQVQPFTLQPHRQGHCRFVVQSLELNRLGFRTLNLDGFPNAECDFTTRLDVFPSTRTTDVDKPLADSPIHSLRNLCRLSAEAELFLHVAPGDITSISFDNSQRVEIWSEGLPVRSLKASVLNDIHFDGPKCVAFAGSELDVTGDLILESVTYEDNRLRTILSGRRWSARVGKRCDSSFAVRTVIDLLTVSVSSTLVTFILALVRLRFRRIPRMKLIDFLLRC